MFRFTSEYGGPRQGLYGDDGQLLADRNSWTCCSRPYRGHDKYDRLIAYFVKYCFSLDIYRRYVDPDVTGKRLALSGRLVAIAAAIASIFFAIVIAAVEEMDLFSRLQSIISFLAPSMSAVFLVGVLWRRAASAAALSTLLVSTIVSLSIGVCYLAKWPH